MILNDLLGGHSAQNTVYKSDITEKTVQELVLVNDRVGQIIWEEVI